MRLWQKQGFTLMGCWLLLVGAAGQSTDATAWPGTAQYDAPLQVEIRTQLDFSRATTSGSGDGQIRIDPHSGAREVGGNIVDLGGSALAGSAVLTGQPGRAVKIDMPLSIKMTSSTGGVIEITNLRTNLPPQAKLDHFGKLEFQFGGDLLVKGSVAGTFRGRIPITAEYE